jgi:hypothetical protein
VAKPAADATGDLKKSYREPTQRVLGLRAADSSAVEEGGAQDVGVNEKRAASVMRGAGASLVAAVMLSTAGL